jgi:hypothetical protein
MKSKSKTAVVVVLAITGALLVATLGYSIAMMTAGSAVYSQGAVSAGYDRAMVPAADQSGDGSLGGMAEAEKSMAGVAGEPAVDPLAATTGSLIVRNSHVEVRVESVDSAIAKLRSAVTAAGGEIADMNVSRGGGPIGQDGQSSSAVPGPAFASVTIRVPADRLVGLEKQVAKLGAVLSQSSSADDVTEAAIDLEARLKNLRAEEVRLRSFLDRTAKVSELLEVERELARVRGEIESMDAQLTYLERQSARATLTVALSEPGPLAESTGITWGLREAFVRGIAVAAAMVTGLVTIAVPAALIALIALFVFIPVRLFRKRRTQKASSASSEPTDGGSAP